LIGRDQPLGVKKNDADTCPVDNFWQGLLVFHPRLKGHGCTLRPSVCQDMFRLGIHLLCVPIMVARHKE
jgi:hypothetical protein